MRLKLTNIMLIIDNIVHLKIEDLVAANIPQSTIYFCIDDGSVEVYKSPEYGKLLPFPSLKWDWKKKVNEFYDGDVKKYIQFQNIENALTLRDADRAVINSYKLQSGTYLSALHRKMYEQKCSILAMIDRISPLTDGKVARFGMVSVRDFWETLYEYIAKKKISLPSSRRLNALFYKYQEEGATAVISKKFDNTNPVKLGSLQIDTIIALYADKDGRKFTKKQVWEQFRYLAKEQGWKSCENITYQAVAGVLKDTRGEWHAERHGEKDFKLNQTLVINRKRASEPNLVWQLDGTPECLWYYDAKRNTIDKLYVLKVMDSHSWKIVGFSTGYAETSHLVFEATKMACTVHQVKPKDMRSDKGSAMQSAETKELMSNLDINFYPTATGNARAKTIEAWQAMFNQQVLVYFKNKSGANINAKTLDSRQNPDKLKANYKDYPTKEELLEQIHFAIHLWNETPDSKGVTPNQKYEHDSPRRRDLDIMEQLDLFYIWRKKGKKIQPYAFDKEGLTMEVQGDKYRYLPNLSKNELADFGNAHIDTTTFYVKYDPSDLEHIGMYVKIDSNGEVNENNLRLLCYAKMKKTTSETYHDATEEDKMVLKKLREAQRLQLENTKNSMVQRRELLEANNVLNGAIELEKVHKDRVNAAKIAVQREQALGYGTTILSDTNKALSQESMEDDLPSFDLPKNGKSDMEAIDVYG